MTVWVLHWWAPDLPNVEVVSWHQALETAIYAALAWIEAERELPIRMVGVYSIAESGEGGGGESTPV